MRLLQLLVSFHLALAIAIFAAQNPSTIALKFFWLHSVQLPLGFVAVLAVGAGLCSACLGLTALLPKPRSRKVNRR